MVRCGRSRTGRLRRTETLRLIEGGALALFSLATIYTDLRWRRIPNVMTYPTMLLGLVLGALEGLPGEPGGAGLADHVSGLLLAFALTYPLYALRLGLGSGDAKFLMAVGAMRGVTFFVVAALYGSIIGGLLAVVLIVLKRLDPPETEQAGRIRNLMKSRLAYGVALAAGVLLALATQR